MTQDTLVRTHFEVRNPGTRDLVGTWPIDDDSTVATAVWRARGASEWWQGIGYAERRKRLDRFRGVIARRINQLAGVMHEEMG